MHILPLLSSPFPYFSRLFRPSFLPSFFASRIMSSRSLEHPFSFMRPFVPNVWETKTPPSMPLPPLSVFLPSFLSVGPPFLAQIVVMRHGDSRRSLREPKGRSVERASSAVLAFDLLAEIPNLNF